MRLITLNIWGGRVFQPLIDFLKSRADSTDIFCFQEVFHTPTEKTDAHEARANIFGEIKNVLGDFLGYYAPAQDGYDAEGAVDFPLSYGLATFVNKSVSVDGHGDIFVFRERNSRKDNNTSIGRNLEFITFKSGNEDVSIFNLHGLWSGGDKNDNNDRLEQSRKVKEFIYKFPGKKKILCGDFNLLSETSSLAILENGMKNLIKDYGVTSTRSSFYPKPAKFADYILVSPDVKVNKFEVLPVEVSDHLPLLLDFD